MSASIRLCDPEVHVLPPSVPSVSVQETPDTATLLDVREPDEWIAGHISGAIHIPLSDLPVRTGELDPDRTLVVVCRSGNRSAHATAWLNQNGFQAVNLVGGMQAWAGQGRNMISDTGGPPVVR